MVDHPTGDMINSEDPDSIHQTAETYYHGNGVEQFYAKAAELFRKAADLGHERSQFSIGHMYQCGEGVERSEEESRRWFDMWQS